MGDARFCLVIGGSLFAAWIFSSGILMVVTTEIKIVADNILTSALVVCLVAAIVGANIMCLRLPSERKSR